MKSLTLRNCCLLLAVLMGVVFSCKQDRVPTRPTPPVLPAGTMLLKDIVVPNLPSPYYHFDYDNTGRATSLSFASGFYNYNISYQNGRIDKMKNISRPNSITLRYNYDKQQLVNRVDYIKTDGTVENRVFLSYQSNKLTKLERKVNLNGEFVTDKVLTMTYYADGNLKMLFDYRPAIPGSNQDESGTVDSYSDYDDKINVDSFGLLHYDFFDHVVFLPGIQLQKNNPGKLYHTAGINEYEVKYTYAYNSRNYPLTAKGDATKFTAGKDPEKFRVSRRYSYY